MRRREFIALIGGAAVFPLAARAQQATRRVAVLMATAETDPEGRARLNAFLEAFQQRGWTHGGNVQVDIRWTGGNPDEIREIVADVVARKPDAIVANSTPVVAELSRATATTPVVFVLVNEPVAQGIIASLPRPGANITGFTLVDVALVAKSIEMLKFMAPALTRVGLMFNPDSYSYYDVYLQALQATQLKPVDVVRSAVRTPADIDAAVAALAAQPGGGIVLPPDPFTAANRAAIRAAAERRRMPYIFTSRPFVKEGALMSYGPDIPDIFRRAADYVDRILKGAYPGNLPAQAPAKFELAVNVKTAKALGLTVPPALLATADEVIE
jgi:putative ABC transport system substrate-binding protein